MPHICFHDLRYTHATLSPQVGIHSKIVSARLGHSTAALTLDFDSHAVLGLRIHQRDTSVRLDADDRIWRSLDQTTEQRFRCPH